MTLRQTLRQLVACFGRRIRRAEVDTKEVDPDFVVDALPEVKRIPLDGKYYAPSRDDFHKVIRRDVTNLMAYEKAKFDCENFAMHFAGQAGMMYGVNTVGVVIDWSSAHSYNVIVYDDDSYEFYEPQTDETFKHADNGMHKLENWVVVI